MSQFSRNITSNYYYTCDITGEISHLNITTHVTVMSQYYIK